MTDWSYDAWRPVDPANWGGQRHDHPSEQDCHLDIGCGTVKKGRIGIDVRPARGVNVIMDLDSGGVFAAAPEPNRDAFERLSYLHHGYRYLTPYGRERLGNDHHNPDYLDYPMMPLPRRNGWYNDAGPAEPYVIGRGLPFKSGSIRSAVSHHALEHVGSGFLPLMDEIYRVLEPGGTFRAITPLFPSSSAVADADHCRYFMEDTWLAFEGHLGDANNPTGSWLDSFSIPYTKARFKITDLEATKRCAPEDHWTNRDVRELRVAMETVK